MAEIRLTSFADAHEAFCNPALRQSLYDAGDVIMKDVLLTLHGEAHKKRRHLELRLFRRNYARFYEQEVFPATAAQAMAPFLAAGEADLVELGVRVTMNLTADFAGIDRPSGSENETDQLLAIVKTFSEGATLVHSDRDHAIVVAEVAAAMEVFSEMFLKPSWQRRLGLIDEFLSGERQDGDLPKDVLTVLLRNQDSIDLPNDVIEREVAFYLQAGSHSTANSMVDAVHEIIGWCEQPLNELDKDPLLLQRCVHEAMRLHPASPVAWRTPVSELTLPNGARASVDDLVVIDLESANRDRSVFGEDADTFNPHRKILRSKTSPFGLTFGTGVHMCTGRDLDGGLAADKETNPETHQYGIVTQLVSSLIQAGMSPHPEKRPTRDSRTTRSHWGYYPVVFEGEPSA